MDTHVPNAKAPSNALDQDSRPPMGGRAGERID